MSESGIYGALKAYAEVRVTGFTGETVVRKVNFGTQYAVDLQSAKEMVSDLRGWNSEFHVSAEFKVIL